MGGNTISIALTLCIIGSSAASFAFGVIVKTNIIKELLNNPEAYKKARKDYLINQRVK